MKTGAILKVLIFTQSNLEKDAERIPQRHTTNPNGETQEKKVITDISKI